ncbi:MAG: hypothetical protein IJZ37_03180 [Clostridia bacterium]|nr:hypothetical protein [Clostridia bacterium]
MTDEIINLLPSKILKEKIAAFGYVFSRGELLHILYKYAPSFHEMLSLLSRFASSDSDEFSKLALLYKEKEEKNFKRFVEESEGFLYEVHIQEPNAGEECYLCTNYPAALKCIDRFHEEYGHTECTRYRIVKRKVFTGDPCREFGEDALGECVLGQNKTLLTVNLYDEGSDCTNHFNCEECEKLCTYRGFPVFYPSFVPDCGAVRYVDYNEKERFGINLFLDSESNPADKLYIIPLDSLYLYYKDFENAHYDHQHIDPPLVENISEEELDEQLCTAYRAYRAYWQPYWQAYLQEETNKTT